MIPIFLFILGAALGSFANAVVWRLHSKRNFVSERSECEYCHHTLAPADLIPIVSWLMLRGRCRYCHLRLSVQHPLTELITGLLFAFSFVWWPGGFHGYTDVLSFGFWLVYLVGMVMLFLYDLHWQLLPDKILIPLIGLAMIEVVLVHAILEGEGILPLAHAGAGIMVLAGFFGFLYLVSKGRWIGFGDVKLGVFMGVVLGMPASLFALFGSYYIAAAIVLPLFVTKMVTRQSKVAFGPFLLISFVLCFFLSEPLSNWLSIIF